MDPDPTFVSSLAPEFAARGYRIESVTSAAAAIDFVRRSPPEIALLDLGLPDGAALELMRQWKLEAPSVAVIFISDTSSLGTVIRALNEGAAWFFEKPLRCSRMFEELDRRVGVSPEVVPAADDHRLGSALLGPIEVDRFFAVSPGLLAVIGFDGYFKMLNPAWTRALGYSVEELCAAPQLDWVHPDDRIKASDEALDIRDGYAVYRFKSRYRCKDGRYRWLEWCATPSPRHRLVYASARDVTRTVELELRLRASNARLLGLISAGEKQLEQSDLTNSTLLEEGQARDEVAAMLVHDLKGPLSVIMANYEYLVEGYEGAGEFLDALQDSRSAGRRMLRLLENLLDLGRLEGRTLAPKRNDVVLGELIESVVEERRMLLRSRAIVLELSAAPELVVSADADLLVRVLENVLDNAFRYTPHAGRLEVELREANGCAEIRIGNSGVAIPVDARAQLFEKFGQSGVDGRGRTNVGLGLYFCRLAIEAQRGTIWIEETERLPTIFAIRLPLRDAVALGELR
ncbi:MAG: ATP-binding protein [Polyangia bacterium]